MAQTGSMLFQNISTVQDSLTTDSTFLKRDSTYPSRSLPDTARISATDSLQNDSLRVRSQPVQSIQAEPKIYYISPSFGFTLTDISRLEGESLSVQWLTSLITRVTKEGEKWQFVGNLFMQYGQFHRKGYIPYKIQDDLLLSLIPSMTLFEKQQIRLFLEVTAETDLGRGYIGTSETNFLDPLFLYETLYIGQRKQQSSNNGKKTLNLSYGLGYSLQQTFAKKFVPTYSPYFNINPNNPLAAVQTQVRLESGYSAILDVIFRNALADNFFFNTSLRTVALLKEPDFKNLSNSRVGSLLLIGLQYDVFTVDYSNRLLYDRNLSKRRQLDQVLVFGVRLNL
jgi:hypothetical protein